MTGLILKYLCFFVLFVNVFAQMCLTPGKKCGDSKQCCGGCCIDNICTNSYDSCILVDYPCLDDYCPPGFECYMYQPPDYCVGCGLQRACRPFKIKSEENSEVMPAK